MNRFSFVAIALALCSGCANASTLPQVASPADKASTPAPTVESSAQVKDDAANLASDSLDLAKVEASKAWDWASAQVSQSFQAAEDKAHRCYQDASKANVTSTDDLKAIAIQCWNNGN